MLELCLILCIFSCLYYDTCIFFFFLHRCFRLQQQLLFCIYSVQNALGLAIGLKRVTCALRAVTDRVLPSFAPKNDGTNTRLPSTAIDGREERCMLTIAVALSIVEAYPPNRLRFVCSAEPLPFMSMLPRSTSI